MALNKGFSLTQTFTGQHQILIDTPAAKDDAGHTTCNEISIVRSMYHLYIQQYRCATAMV